MWCCGAQLSDTIRSEMRFSCVFSPPFRWFCWRCCTHNRLATANRNCPDTEKNSRVKNSSSKTQTPQREEPWIRVEKFSHFISFNEFPSSLPLSPHTNCRCTDQKCCVFTSSNNNSHYKLWPVCYLWLFIKEKLLLAKKKVYAEECCWTPPDGGNQIQTWKIHERNQPQTNVRGEKCVVEG